MGAQNRQARISLQVNLPDKGHDNPAEKSGKTKTRGFRGEKLSVAGAN